MLRKKQRLIGFSVSVAIFLIFSIYNYIINSQWIFDSIISILFLIFLFFISKWIKLDYSELFLLNFALLLHNLGTFDAYALSFGFVEWDNLVHFASALVAAYIIFDFLLRKLHIKEKQRVKRTVIDEHKAIFIFLVIAAVAFLGAFVEVLEFGGFVFLGEGDGLLFTGSGDMGKTGDINTIYFDTMTDIVVNTLGSIAGVFLFYFLEYKKKPWLKY